MTQEDQLETQPDQKIDEGFWSSKIAAWGVTGIFVVGVAAIVVDIAVKNAALAESEANLQKARVVLNPDREFTEEEVRGKIGDFFVFSYEDVITGKQQAGAFKISLDEDGHIKAVYHTWNAPEFMANYDEFQAASKDSKMRRKGLVFTPDITTSIRSFGKEIPPAAVAFDVGGMQSGKKPTDGAGGYRNVMQNILSGGICYEANRNFSEGNSAEDIFLTWSGDQKLLGSIKVIIVDEASLESSPEEISFISNQNANGIQVLEGVEAWAAIADQSRFMQWALDNPGAFMNPYITLEHLSDSDKEMMEAVHRQSIERVNWASTSDNTRFNATPIMMANGELLPIIDFFVADAVERYSGDNPKSFFMLGNLMAMPFHEPEMIEINSPAEVNAYLDVHSPDGKQGQGVAFVMDGILMHVSLVPKESKPLVGDDAVKLLQEQKSRMLAHQEINSEDGSLPQGAIFAPDFRLYDINTDSAFLKYNTAAGTYHAPVAVAEIYTEHEENALRYAGYEAFRQLNYAEFLLNADKGYLQIEGYKPAPYSRYYQPLDSISLSPSHAQESVRTNGG